MKVTVSYANCRVVATFETACPLCQVVIPANTAHECSLPEPPSRATLKAGDVLTLGSRTVIVVPGNGGVAKNWRGAVAVRNSATNRLSYIPEWKLLRAKRRG